MDSPDMGKLRRLVKEAREAPPRLTIEEAAEAAGVKAQAWQYLEWNRRTPPPVPELRRILSTVGLDPDATLRECGLL